MKWHGPKIKINKSHYGGNILTDGRSWGCEGVLL